MSQKQKGTSIVGFIAIIAVLALIGFVGFYMWDKNKTQSAVTSNNAPQVASVTAKSTPTPTPSVAPKNNVPDGYVLYENANPKFSFVYPKEWDSHKAEGWTRGVNIQTKNTNEWIPYGWGTPLSYKYEPNPGRWMKMDMNSKEQDLYAIKTLWKDDLKTVYDMSQGEGGGWQNQVVFIIENKIIYIQAPTMGACESANGCYDDSNGVSIKSSEYLEQIARSVTY